MSARASQYSSVLQNAGITDGLITNTDKYFAIRLQKEFIEVIAELEVESKGTIDKS